MGLLFFFFSILSTASAKSILTPIDLHSFNSAFYSEIKSENKVILILSVPVGIADDPKTYPDLTHLMEHLFISMNEGFSKNTILKNTSISGITQAKNTQYVINIEPEDIDKTFKYFDWFFNRPEFKIKDISAQLHEIEEEESPKNVKGIELVKYIQSLGDPEHEFSNRNLLPINVLNKKTLNLIQDELNYLHQEKYKNKATLILYASKKNFKKIKKIDKKYAGNYSFNSLERSAEMQIKRGGTFIKTNSSLNTIKGLPNQEKDELYFISPVRLNKSIVNDLDVNIFEYLITLKGKGSLFHYLHEKGLVSGVDFERVNLDFLEDLFITSFSLTKSGKENIPEIKKQYLAYLKYLSKFEMSIDSLRAMSEIKESHLTMPNTDVTSNFLIQILERNGLAHHKDIQSELSDNALKDIYVDFKNQVWPFLIQDPIVCFCFTDAITPNQVTQHKTVGDFNLSRINNVKYQDYPGYEMVDPKENPMLIFQNNFSQVYFKKASSDIKTAKVTLNLHFKTGGKVEALKRLFFQQAIQEKLADWKDISKIDGSFIKIEENISLKGKPVNSIIFYAKEEDIVEKLELLAKILEVSLIENQSTYLKAILKEDKRRLLEEGGLDFISQVVMPEGKGQLTYQDIEGFDFNTLEKEQKLNILSNVSMLLHGDVSQSLIDQLTIAMRSNVLFSEVEKIDQVVLTKSSLDTIKKERVSHLREFGEKPEVTVIEYKVKTAKKPMLSKLLYFSTILDNHEHFKQKTDQPYYKYEFIEFNQNLYYNFYYSNKHPYLILSDLRSYLAKNYKKNQLVKFYFLKYFLSKKISVSDWSFREYNRYYQAELMNQTQGFRLQAELLKSWDDFSYWQYKKTYKKYLLNPKEIHIYTNHAQLFGQSEDIPQS